jgi:methylated-DNA-[protein]-cysteine S-methyltransferase
MGSDVSRIWLSTYRSPVGALLLGVHDGHLCLCDWAGRARRSRIDRRLERAFAAGLTKGQHPLLAEAGVQLDQYFVGKRRDFDLPLGTAGTAFQSDVWEALAGIPYGEIRTYRQLAESLGQPGAVRAVASAIGANALSIFLPCHRVIGSNGQLVGYAGGIEAKQGLLALESRQFVA